MATIIVFSGQKGGGGKSISARATGAELKRWSLQKGAWRVVVVDLDVAQRTTLEWSEARIANGIKPDVDVVVVDADEEPDFRIPELSKTYHYIVVDAPGWSDEITTQLAAVADLTVLPSGPSIDDLRPTIRLFHELKNAGIPEQRITILLNRVDTPAEQELAEEYLKKAGIKPLKAVIRNQVCYRSAVNVGQAITEVSPEGPRLAARKAVAEVFKALERAQKPSSKHSKAPQRFVLKQGETW